MYVCLLLSFCEKCRRDVSSTQQQISCHCLEIDKPAKNIDITRNTEKNEKGEIVHLFICFVCNKKGSVLLYYLVSQAPKTRNIFFAISCKHFFLPIFGVFFLRFF